MKNSIIFCVDDEKVILNSLKTELKNALGNQLIIETAESGEEALNAIHEIISEHVEIPVVISDYLMPNMKGDEFLHKIHQLLPETFTILLTGQANMEAITNSINNAGLYRYIEKPWESNDLVITINEALKSFEQRKQLEEKNNELLELSASLENKVKKRTAELTNKNNLLLSKQDEIKKQNLELERYRNHLENLVDERTRELVLAKEKAEENDQLKSAFISNISHEIRTPINGIVGFLNLFKNQQISEEKKTKYIEIIENSSNQLLSIIEDIIQISRVDVNQVRPRYAKVNINELLENLQTTFNQNIPAKKKIHVVVSKILCFHEYNCYTDKGKLQQIMSNLIGNAIKFTENGIIDFGCEIIENKFLKFYVHDSGIGIAKENHEMIFDRFRQVKFNSSKTYGGNGLGLAISKALVELLGGQIWVESEPEKGASFYFTIPYLTSYVENEEK